MITAYDVVKFLHVFLAIIAVGFNASYGIWLARAARDSDHEMHVLRGIKVLDDRFANPAYGLLLVTGLIMIAISGVRITDFWIAASLALYALVVVVGAGFYTPLCAGRSRSWRSRAHGRPISSVWPRGRGWSGSGWPSPP